MTDQQLFEDWYNEFRQERKEEEWPALAMLTDREKKNLFNSLLFAGYKLRYHLKAFQAAILQTKLFKFLIK